MLVRYLKWNVVNLNQPRSALTQLVSFFCVRDVNACHIVFCMSHHYNSAPRVGGVAAAGGISSHSG